MYFGRNNNIQNKVKYFKLRKVNNPLAFNNLTLTASKGKTL